jgi:hypothetical protein
MKRENSRQWVVQTLSGERPGFRMYPTREEARTAYRLACLKGWFVRLMVVITDSLAVPSEAVRQEAVRPESVSPENVQCVGDPFPRRSPRCSPRRSPSRVKARRSQVTGETRPFPDTMTSLCAGG